MRIDRWIGSGIAAALSLMGALTVGNGIASASAVVELSRTSISFGFVPADLPILQVVFVTNTGDAPLNISSISLTGANASEFKLGGTCSVPIQLAAGGGRCRLEVSSYLAPVRSGARSAAAVVTTDALPDAPAINLTANYAFELQYGGLQTTPAWLDFGNEAVGTAAAGQTVTISSQEIIPATFERVFLVGGDSTDFTLTTNCVPGSKLVNGLGTCTTTVGFMPTTTGPRSTELEFDLDVGSYRYSITGIGGNAAPVMPVAAIEFYNAGQDHYFMTWVADEVAILDAGVKIKGWTRTGYSFNTYSMPQAGTSPVCRFYIPPELGDSHFYGRGTAECNATGQNHPTFVLEDPDFMNMILPVAGVCPAGTTNVYRVFDNRLDANHRYMTDKAVRDQMVAKGWVAEGDGPDLVVMCAPT